MRPAGAWVFRPPRSPVDDDSRPLIGPGVLILLALFLTLLWYDSRSNTAAQWAIGLLGLGILAAVASRWIARGTADPEPLLGPAVSGSIRAGEIEALSQTVRRATRGLPYSQVLVTSRARSAFLERVRLAHGLSPEATRQTEPDPEALRALVRDDVLVDFLHLRTGDLEDRYGWVLRARARRGFAREFRDVLDRMEAWR